MSRKKKPSTALMKDLKEVFAKHNWPGDAIGLREMESPEAVGDCPPDTTPHEVTYQLPDGTWVAKTVCF